MLRPRSFVRTPTFVVLVATFLLFSLYLSLIGDQGNAVRFFRGDRNLYVSMQDYGRLVQYEVFKEDIGSAAATRALALVGNKKIATLENPPPKALRLKIKKVGEVDLPGSVVSSAAASNTLFVVDRWNGIYRLGDNLADKPRPQKTSFFGARDIAVMEDYAFVSGGPAGIYIYDTAIPAATMVITGFVDTPGTADALWLVSRNLKDSTQQRNEQTGLIETVVVTRTVPGKLWVADGDAGVLLLDVSVPLNPTEITTIKPGGHVYDVFVDASRLYVAKGLKGWSLINVRDPKNVAPLVERDTQGEVRDIAANENWIVVANGSGGLLIYANSINPAEIPQEPVVFDTPGFVSGVELVNNYALIADGVEGIRVIDLANPALPVERAAASTPGAYTLRQMLAYGGMPKGSTEREKYDLTMKDIRNEMFMLIFGTVLIFLPIFAITLPASDLSYWLQSKRGRPVVVEGGQVISHQEQEHAALVRAIHIDSASAAAVVDPAGARWLGPGLGFLQPAERLSRTLDIRPMLLLCGPELQEDPFAAWLEGESDLQQKQRQVRRMQTSAKTRDNREIVPNLLVDVRVAGRPGEGGSEYGFSAENAQLAMRPEMETYAHTLPFMASAQGWQELVTNLATRLWFFYLGKYSLPELFAPQPDPQGVFGARLLTGLQRVEWMMQHHLTDARVPRLDENGQLTAQTMRSSEYEALLRRGLSVERLQVINLRLEKEISSEYLAAWQATWPTRTQEKLQQSTVQDIQVQQDARQAAQQRFGEIVSRPLRALQRQPRQPGADLGKKEMLTSLVRGTLNLKELDEGIRRRLNELLAWLEGWTDGS